MAYKYALPGPPFNFLGNMSQTQATNFKTWVNARTSNFPAIQFHHQMRAQQLRKTAGVLEQFYATENDQKLTPSFQKAAWQPGPDGHFNFAYRNDHDPMVTVSQVKRVMQEQFQRDDEGVFFMNHIRTQIEKHEDAAQHANDAVNSSIPDNVTQLLSLLDSYFARPEYQAVLVNDQTDTYGTGDNAGPRFRVHQFDEPTYWELRQMSHSDEGVAIQNKELPGTT